MILCSNYLTYLLVINYIRLAGRQTDSEKETKHFLLSFPLFSFPVFPPNLVVPSFQLFLSLQFFRLFQCSFFFGFSSASSFPSYPGFLSFPVFFLFPGCLSFPASFSFPFFLSSNRKRFRTCTNRSLCWSRTSTRRRITWPKPRRNSRPLRKNSERLARTLTHTQIQTGASILGVGESRPPQILGRVDRGVVGVVDGSWNIIISYHVQEIMY